MARSGYGKSSAKISALHELAHLARSQQFDRINGLDDQGHYSAVRCVLNAGMGHTKDDVVHPIMARPLTRGMLWCKAAWELTKTSPGLH
jgi:hypothetical protein